MSRGRCTRSDERSRRRACRRRELREWMMQRERVLPVGDRSTAIPESEGGLSGRSGLGEEGGGR